MKNHSQSELIAATAQDYVDVLLAEMIEGNHDDNQVLLGTVLIGNREVQIQLHVTANPETMMDES